MSASLETKFEDRVLRVTLNRPEKRNALTFAMCRELAEIIEAAGRDAGVGAVLLRASGGAFCAGMDLDEASAPDAADHVEAHERLFTIGARVEVPIVAAVAGPALGGGLGLAANAHIIVAAQGASFGLTEIRIGMWPFVVFRSVAIAIGERRALELALTGRIVGTEEALNWGLAQYVVPVRELDDRAREIAAGLAASAPDTIRRGLRFFRETRELDWNQAGRAAAEARKAVFGGADFREGVAAFREKRKPSWRQPG